MNYQMSERKIDFLDYEPRRRVNPLDYVLTPNLQLTAMERLGKDVRTKIHGLEKLAEDVPSQTLADQIIVMDRVISLIGHGFGNFVGNLATQLYEGNVSGGSRHSFCLMGTYENDPLNTYALGRFDGSDFLNGKEVDLFGKDKEVKNALKQIRTEEGVGLLRINYGNYALINSGVAFPFDCRPGQYNSGERRGMMISSVLDFSRRYHSRSDHPVWFFKLNRSFSLIQNGRTYDVDYE